MRPAGFAPNLSPMDVPRTGVAAKKRKRRIIIIAASALGLILATIAISRLKPAVPSVDRSTVWVDTVKRGPMVRQVRGLGTLVPEDIRWIPANTEGRLKLCSRAQFLVSSALPKVLSAERSRSMQQVKNLE